MRASEGVQGGDVAYAPKLDPVPSPKKVRPHSARPAKSAKPNKTKSARREKSRAKEPAAGSLPVLYMLSPQKFMSPFDCNMAVDSGYKVVLPYDGVTVSNFGALV